MKLFEYAIFRHAAQCMAPAELALMQELARMADAGDREAYEAARELALQAIRHHARAKSKSGAA